MIRKIIFFLFVFLNANQLSSKTSFGDSTVLPSAQFDLISTYIAQFPDQTQLSIAIINNENVHFVGLQKTGNQLISVDNKDSVFEIGSITKIFTSAILSSLVQDSILRLDDSIDGILPIKLKESSKHDIPITYKTLANHTSGLPFEADNLEISVLKNPYNPYAEYSYDLFDDYLTNSMKLHSIPGQKFQYSNLGYGLLGYLLESKTDTEYESLVQELVFNRYNMNHSSSDYIKVEELVVKGLDSIGKVMPYWFCNSLKASGGILSNVMDLSKFMIANFSSDSILDLQRKVTFSNMNNHVALGWEMFEIGGSACSINWYHKTGGMGGYSSAIVMDINTRIGVVLLSNISSYHKNENTLQLGVDILKQVFISDLEDEQNECNAPFLELALINGWGTHLNEQIAARVSDKSTIEGVWEKPSVMRTNIGIQTTTRTFLPDGKVQSDFMGDPQIDVWGYYKLYDDEIIFEDVGGNACKAIGKYTFSIENDKLIFKLVEDSCEGRVQGLSGAWIRKSKIEK